MYIGLDIGGTKTLACSAGEDGRILDQVRFETPVGVENGITRIREAISRLTGGAPVQGIGVSIGGPLDFRTGRVSPLHQPEWRDVPLRDLLQNDWQCPVAIDVDTNVAALGEYAAAPDSPRRLLYLTISTGMGGGFVTNGRIYRGAGGAHPEIAHQSIHYRSMHPERVVCECGLQDCLEGLVSGNAIRRIYQKPAEALSEEEWEEVSYNLGQGLRNLAAVLAPEVIALGGGVAIGRGERLVHAAGDVMRSHLRLVPAPKLHLSRAGYFTALHGAVHVALHGLAGLS